ncbi:MAG TPA: DUF423 domain-containing protein [Flavobacteriaceae bacterium]|nr:DUF423 domain-containing protein [Flavobacteriaceae bacterium]
MNVKIVAGGMFLAAITIALGAFGAHGLKQIVSPEVVNTFEVGIRYQMYHAFAIILLGLIPMPNNKRNGILWNFVVGILFFSGSIYLLTLNDYLPFDAKKIGFITPIGGVLLINAWIRWAYGILKESRN